MAGYRYHIFVCENQREAGHPRGCCAARGAEMVREALKSEIKKNGAASGVRVNKAGCLDQCEHGVTLVVYPDAVWYGFVQPADVAEIVQSHIIGGRPVERLRLKPECIASQTCSHRGNNNAS
ncbi:MAG: hypothetical protein JNG88_15015 [Phycisphaerales bacterium]|nr:hypothetical protein [Phycisphaerales bacterium]